ncbi:MAG: nucleotidyltransferase family protein, partial [Acidimicrobiales bacterium]
VTVLGVVLAAGEGRRFRASGGAMPKQRVEVDGRSLLRHAVDAALQAGLDEVVVVAGAVDLHDLVDDVTVLQNPRWAEGMATSLQAAVAHATAAGHAALVVGLADQPDVRADDWRAVAAAPDEPPIAVATYQGQRGNPVRLAQAVWTQLPTTGDAGARQLIRGQPHLVREVPCPGAPDDVDTVEDLDRWS